jgi:all-trans-8'-apo-beta-carotenal 15,15'-oxygenase
MTPPDRMSAQIQGAFQTTATEGGPVGLRVVEGEVPREISGAVWRNGPGRHGRGPDRYGHPFDGDGFIQRLTLEEGRATWTGRWVRTPEFTAEEAADRILFRNFGTNKPGGLLANIGRMRFKNAANTSVVAHAGRLLALWEGGLPTAIDPDTAGTLGRTDYGGALRNRFGWLDAALSPELPFSAHPRVDHATGELWNFGTAYGRQHRLLVHRVDADGHLSTRDLPLDELPFVHDFALTRRWAVFVLPATRFDIPRALLGLSTPVAALRVDHAPGTAWLVPRDGGEPVRIAVPPGFVFHWAHAYDDDDGAVVLDGVEYPGFPDLGAGLDKAFGPDGSPQLLARPIRLRLDPAQRRATHTVLSDHAMEFPSCAAAVGERHEHFWSTAAPPDRRQPFLSALARFTPATGAMVSRELFPHLPGEPLPIGHGLLCLPVWTADQTSEIWLVRDDDLSTVARLALPHPVPPPLHGTWVGSDGMG